MHPFSALADPKRRTIMELLGTHGKMSATKIYENFNVSDSAISQHLKVLKKSNLIKMEKKAQQRIYELNPAFVFELKNWVEKLTIKLDERFDALDKVLKEEKLKLSKEKENGGKKPHE